MPPDEPGGGATGDRLARDVELLIEAFGAGGWSELRVETDALTLLLSTDPDAALAGFVKGGRPLPYVAER